MLTGLPDNHTINEFFPTSKLTQRLCHLQPDSDHCKEVHPTRPPLNKKKTDPNCDGGSLGTGRLSCGRSPALGRDPRIVLWASMLSMGLAWRRGERLWENLRVSYFSRLLSQLNVAARPTIGLKKRVKSNCCGSLMGFFWNYVFMNLHNSLFSCGIVV